MTLPVDPSPTHKAPIHKASNGEVSNGAVTLINDDMHEINKSP